MVLHGTIFNTTNVAKIDVCNVSFMGDFQRKIFNATNVAEPKLMCVTCHLWMIFNERFAHFLLDGLFYGTSLLRTNSSMSAEIAT